jgi:type IV pilus biogenesis protein CpaD/CtpE
MKNYLLLSCALLLTACGTGGSLKPSMYENSTHTQRSIEINEERFVQAYMADKFTENDLEMITDLYSHDAASPLYIALSYDANNRLAKQRTESRVNIVRNDLEKMKIKNATVKAVPTTDTTERIVVGYDRLIARGPQNCGTMPGMDQSQTGSYGDYGMGCTVMDMMAKQIAYPADLLGQGGLGGISDGGQAAAIVNRDVRAGEIREEIPTYILSEIGSD